MLITASNNNGLSSNGGLCNFSPSAAGAVIELDFGHARQDHWHCLTVKLSDQCVRLGRQECKDLIGGFALLNLWDRSPLRPYPGEICQRADPV
jgi:hypothetical protein